MDYLIDPYGMLDEKLAKGLEQSSLPQIFLVFSLILVNVGFIQVHELMRILIIILEAINAV